MKTWMVVVGCILAAFAVACWSRSFVNAPPRQPVAEKQAVPTSDAEIPASPLAKVDVNSNGEEASESEEPIIVVGTPIARETFELDVESAVVPRRESRPPVPRPESMESTLRRMPPIGD